MMKWCGEVPEIRAENDVKRDQHEANAFWKVLFVVKMVWSMLYVTKPCGSCCTRLKPCEGYSMRVKNCV